MTMELSLWPARIRRQYHEVYTVTKPSHGQVGSWTDTLSLLQKQSMLVILNNMQWWWWCNCNTITFIKDWRAHPPMCCNKVKLQQAVDCLADLLDRPLCLILLEQWQCSLMTHDDNRAIIMASKDWTAIPHGMWSQSPVPAKLVAGLALCLSFQEQNWCS